MPTSTIPFEVLFELVNDTHEPVMMQVLQQEDGERTGATVLLHRGETISLVLTAGVPYKYAVKRSGHEATLSVKLWKDTRYCLWNVFRRSRPSTDSEKGRETMLEGVVVTSQTNTRTYATR